MLTHLHSDKAEARMEQEKMLLDTLVEELQQSYFDIPFEAWRFICKKLRNDLQERFPSHKKFKELTDIEARLMYSRYMFHVTTNYRQLCKSIITGYPNFSFPDEVKKMLLMAKYKDIQGEDQLHLISLSSSPSPSPSPSPCRTTVNKLVNYEDDDCASTIGNLDKRDSGQRNESMISPTIQQQQPDVVVDDEQQQDVLNVDSSIPPSSRHMDKAEDSRVLFINPEPPVHKSMKRENKQVQSSLSSSDVHEAASLLPQLITTESRSPQPTEQFDAQNNAIHDDDTNENSTAQAESNGGTGQEEIETEPDCESHSDPPSTSINLKREYGAQQHMMAIKRIRLEDKIPWVTPRVLCLPERVKYVNQNPIKPAKRSEFCTADNFTLISCEPGSDRRDPRKLGLNLSCNDDEEVIVLDNDEEVIIFKDNEERGSPLLPNNINNTMKDDPIVDDSRNCQEGVEESEPTANNLIENELSKIKDNATKDQLEENEDISSIEEEEESEGEEVAPETFGECFERRRRASHDDGCDAASTISSMSDSSSSFYFTSYTINNAHSIDNNKNPVISPNLQQPSVGGGRSLSLSSNTDKGNVFKITIDNEYCNKTHAATPPLVSPSSSVSLDPVIITAPENSMYHDIDERLLPKVNMNPIVIDSSTSNVSSSNSQSILSPNLLPNSQLVNKFNDNGKNPSVVIPSTAPFHWHAINYPAALNNGVPTLSNCQYSPQQTAQGSNPWVEAFDACHKPQNFVHSAPSVVIINRRKNSNSSSHSHVPVGPPKFNFPAPSNHNPVL